MGEFNGEMEALTRESMAEEERRREEGVERRVFNEKERRCREELGDLEMEWQKVSGDLRNTLN